MTNEEGKDVLQAHERGSLTVWGRCFSAQSREDGGLALYVRHDAPRDASGVAILPAADVVKLDALLGEMKRRGRLSPGGEEPLIAEGPGQTGVCGVCGYDGPGVAGDRCVDTETCALERRYIQSASGD